MTKYEAVIGLEIHARLRTRSKIFCRCPTSFGASPNTSVCPVCLGFPGALPVLNRTAVDFGVLAALALGCDVNETSIFARKNYFYPDLPKGYQISQYERPLASGGLLEFVTQDGPQQVGIIRVHLEEDAGKSLHTGFHDSDRKTYVDYNRAGTPLIEIVTEPDLREAAAAAECFSRLRTILVWLGVNDGNMEEGSLRCDANVSVRTAGASAFGTKAEVKNINSFRFLQKALEYEIGRQIDVVEGGSEVVQETRLWDASRGVTHSMRSKEEAHDYRYFPEPDLPPLVVTRDRVEALRQEMPELPDTRQQRFVDAYALPAYDAVQLTQARDVADFFESTIRAGAPAKLVSNWMMGELTRVLNALGRDVSRSPVSPERLAGLLALVETGEISGAIAKSVFEKMLESEQTAADIVRTQGLAQIDDDSTIMPAIERVLESNADAVEQYRGGKTATLGFLVGQVMRATGGKANPKRVNELLRAALEGQ